ncbi:MAG: hypothetical protein IPG44_11755 [Anaerolineales bacterium]|nr:hypothetical protein [Anaerolineales bacterium]
MFDRIFPGHGHHHEPVDDEEQVHAEHAEAINREQVAAPPYFFDNDQVKQQDG